MWSQAKFAKCMLQVPFVLKISRLVAMDALVVSLIDRTMSLQRVL